MKTIAVFAAISNSGQLQMKEVKMRMKVKKGWLAVRVGGEDEDGGSDQNDQRFTMPISHLSPPQFSNLLEQAQEIYGFHGAGPLRLPCSVDYFLQLRWTVEKEMRGPSPSSPCSPPL